MRLTKNHQYNDEEFGKKDDDHWRSRDAPKLPRLPSWRVLRRRRALLAIVGIYLLYTLFSKTPLIVISSENPCNEPSIGTQLEEKSQGDRITPSSGSELAGLDGPVRFPGLTKSLYSFEKARKEDNQNHVLFAAANLQGISELASLACDMASKNANIVHFAVMGRHEVPVRTLLKVNGIDATDCRVYWHDARPNNGQSSSEYRMEQSVRRALDRMKTFIEPQVVITNNNDRDELFLGNGITQQASKLGFAHIPLPHMASDLGWISDLDINSLKAWNEIRIEILIQAPSRSSGSLLRLLRSVDQADYLGSTVGMTIELPENVDPFLLRHIENRDWALDSQSSKLTLRPRTIPHTVTPEVAAARILEAFYPQNPAWSHILFLSPQAELSPSYFHYLQYTLLKYKYSSEAQSLSERLFGISLELPSSGLSENDFFTPYFTENDYGESSPLGLWQEPNSNAVLYFGDKWADLHNFVSNRLVFRRQNSLRPPTTVSRKYPSFMKNVLELSKARGYYLLYPFFYAGAGVSLAMVHNEPYQPPEKYAVAEVTKADGESLASDTSKSYADDEGRGSFEQILYGSWTVTDLLRDFSLDFPSLSSMPIISYTGEKESDISGTSRYYATEFSKQYGDCGSSDGWGMRQALKSDDLFCLNGEGQN